MIEKFFKKKADVYRKVATQATEETSYKQIEEALSSVYGCFQTASAELAEGFAMERSKSFVFWCSLTSDIEISDRLVIDNVNYIVKGIRNNTYGENKHKECILEAYGISD